LLFAGAKSGADVQNPVGINVERDLDLRHSARGGREVVSWNLPIVLVVPRETKRRPGRTWNFHAGWLSEAVEKISDLRVESWCCARMSFVNTPPSVSMPSDSGVRRATGHLDSPMSTRPGSRRHGHDLVRITP